MITAELFEALVGRPPAHDDLERVNCKVSGQLGHESCGWCSLKDAPVYHGCALREAVYDWKYNMVKERKKKKKKRWVPTSRGPCVNCPDLGMCLDRSKCSPEYKRAMGG